MPFIKKHPVSDLLKCFIVASVVLILFATYLKSFTILQQDKPSLVRFVKTTRVIQNNKFPLVHEFEVESVKKFDNEQARLVGFSLRNGDVSRKNTSTKILYLATQYFGEWNPKHYYFPHLGNVTFTRYPCAIHNCYVTNNPSDIRRSHAVLFHVRDLEIFSVSSYRLPEQIWILYSMEPAWLEIKDLKRFNGVFNWTMSYRRGSDLRVTYGFIGQKTRPKTTSRDMPDNLFEGKSDEAVWYVSNCRTDSNREEYIELLRKVYPVQVIGGCGKKGCRPAETKKCYTEIASRYKFYLAFENAVCRDYVTEKLYNSLEYYIIPVAFGGGNYSDIMPMNSVINAMDFSSPKELGDFLWRVSRDKSLYMSFFEWKATLRPYLQPWMCDLCEKLHSPGEPGTAHNLDDWWTEGGSCRRWSTAGFRPVSYQVFPRYGTRLFA